MKLWKMIFRFMNKWVFVVFKSWRSALRQFKVKQDSYLEFWRGGDSVLLADSLCRCWRVEGAIQAVRSSSQILRVGISTGRRLTWQSDDDESQNGKDCLKTFPRNKTQHRKQTRGRYSHWNWGGADPRAPFPRGHSPGVIPQAPPRKVSLPSPPRLLYKMVLSSFP